MQETQVLFPGREDPLEKEMVTLSSILAWRIPWIEEPDGLQSMGLQRVRYDWAANTSYDNSMFNLSSTCQAVFQRACIHSCQQCVMVDMVSFEMLTIQFCCWHQIRLCVTLQFQRELKKKRRGEEIENIVNCMVFHYYLVFSFHNFKIQFVKLFLLIGKGPSYHPL